LLKSSAQNRKPSLTDRHRIMATVHCKGSLRLKQTKSHFRTLHVPVQEWTQFMPRTSRGVLAKRGLDRQQPHEGRAVCNGARGRLFIWVPEARSATEDSRCDQARVRQCSGVTRTAALRCRREAWTAHLPGRLASSVQPDGPASLTDGNRGCSAHPSARGGGAFGSDLVLE
jgi:hypothetical protein